MSLMPCLRITRKPVASFTLKAKAASATLRRQGKEAVHSQQPSL
ncbi:hypothetical protein [Halotia branconii]|uniref:Uncharacterized protein n=1 Tax=Halotia branconii CENA392 TaxID=1539056 RepID=A0AAJ6NT11_9CYAN|nr:hypothetical protein [Halotia branconii]WGV25944.1 hypothetical protein QI031_30280 [Halotia branconii CENA392]WGV25960.1 hypothetical protein QI031_00090 [Halotia branconii CENA392]